MQKLPLITKANVGAAVSVLVLVLAQFHINISDAAPAITDALTQVSDGVIALAGLILFIYGHFETRGQLADALNQLNGQLSSVTLKSTVEATAAPLSESTPPIVQGGKQVGTFNPNSLAKASVVAAVALVVLSSLGLGGCALSTATSPSTGASSSGGTSTASTNLTNIGYEIESFLQQSNDGVTAAAPGVEQFLQQTGNAKDAQTVALYTSLANLFTQTVTAGLKAGLPAQQVQANVNTALAPANAQAVASQMAASSN